MKPSAITPTQLRKLVKRHRKTSCKFRDWHLSSLIDYLSGLGYDVKTEYKFHPTRRWRFDIAIPELKIAVEYEGVYGKGQSRHTSAGGYTGDCDKYNEAVVLGWRVLRFTAKNVKGAQNVIGRAAQ
jgi:very-short-patch-repair endonuclease